jgi:spore germination protein KA
MQYTERPDKVAASLLEGRVALVVDGSPNVILLPLLFVQLLQSPEDYYTRMIPGTFMRWIRYMGVLIAILFPSLYVAITSYHPEILPLNLLLSIAAAREGIPFPAFIEALIMELCFELLREASIRLPGAIGNTIGIVGALVIGDAAVSAHLVAPQMVIVVAITAIGSFAVPSMEASYPIRLLRFPLMLLAAAFGLYGVALGVMGILIHLLHLRSFGFPYLEPLAPLKGRELQDVLMRAPRWQMMVKPQFQSSTLQTENVFQKRFWERRNPPLEHKGDDSRGKQ